MLPRWVIPHGVTGTGETSARQTPDMPYTPPHNQPADKLFMCNAVICYIHVCADKAAVGSLKCI